MDVAALIQERAEKLDIETVAQKDATRGLPSRKTSSMTTVETGAVAEAEQCGKQELQSIDSLVGDARKALGDSSTALAAARSRRKAISDAVPPAGVDLESRIRDRDRAQAEYTAFKSDNGLARDASGDDRMTQVLWALVIVLCEGIVNSYFYAPVSAFGLLGGAFIAFFVAFGNVAFGFLGGAGGLRNLAHVDPVRKLAGIFVSLSCALICLLVVAVTTLFRGQVDLLQGGGMDPGTMEDEAWRLAVESLRELDVWALMSSVNSFLLVLVGLICAILGFYKGWEYDDRYPGFGAVFRAKEKAAEAYDDAREEGEERLAAWKAERVAALRETEAHLESCSAAMTAACQGLGVLLLQCDQLGSDVWSLAKGLLGVYRKKNEEVRADAPPTYFGSFPDAGEFSYLDEAVLQRRQEVEQLRTEVARTQDRVADEQGRIEEAVAGVRSP